MSIIDNRISILYLLILIFVISFGATVYVSLSKYVNYTPDALKDESEEVKKTFLMQKCGWQYKIAYLMISNRIREIELTLNRIANNSEFIEPYNISFEDYYKWLEMRPTILLRLIKSVCIQCTKDFPEYIGSATSEDKMFELKNRVNHLVSLYEYAKNFEIDYYRIIPPSNFAEMHEMAYEWTEPIRKGINEFVDILNEVSSYDERQIKKGLVHPPSFDIVFKAPSNIEEFNRRLDNIDINSINLSD